MHFSNIILSLKFILLLFGLIIHKRAVAAIKLKSIGLAYTDSHQVYTDIINDFNNYAKANNIDVELSINLYTPSNSSILVNQYGNAIDFLLSKNSTKYDIIFYDTLYSWRFSPFLTDIKGRIPEDHLNLYSPGIASQTCLINGKWVGLPLYVDYSVMYVNTGYLNKYNQDIPTTWDKLLEVGKMIYYEELRQGNIDIIGYNGLFPDEEVNMCSTLELIYSFRNELNSPMPEYTSKEAEMALNKMKEIKEKLSTDDMFNSEIKTMESLFRGSSIFLKYWNLHLAHSPYQKVRLPGNKENISGTCIGGYNIGINDSISEEKKTMAVEALLYMTSRDVQKKYVMDGRMVSAIPALYEDEDVCAVLDCGLIRGLQPLARPSSIHNYDEYSHEHTMYIHEFLFDGKTATETLNNINNILKIYTITLNPKESIEGFMVFLVTIALALMILLSLLYIYVKGYRTSFNFLTRDLWAVSFSGILLVLVYVVSEYGDLNAFKCILKVISLCFGYRLIVVPSLYQLLVNFPEKNKYSRWIRINKLTFLSLFALVSVVEIVLLFVSSPFELDVRTIPRGRNFKVCKFHKVFGIMVTAFIVVKVFLLQGVIGLLVFVEWNITKTAKDIKLTYSGLSISFVLFMIIITMNFIKFNNFKVYFSIYTTTVLLLSLINYIFMFWLRMTPYLSSADINDSFLKNDMSEFKTTISKNNDDANSDNTNLKRSNNNFNNEKMSILSNTTSKNKFNIINNNSNNNNTNNNNTNNSFIINNSYNNNNNNNNNINSIYNNNNNSNNNSNNNNNAEVCSEKISFISNNNSTKNKSINTNYPDYNSILKTNNDGNKASSINHSINHSTNTSMHNSMHNSNNLDIYDTDYKMGNINKVLSSIIRCHYKTKLEFEITEEDEQLL